MTGHSVLAVPVPVLDTLVRDRTTRTEASFVSRDPGFVHAHITVLGPWLDDPTPDDLEAIGEVVRAHPAFEVELVEVKEFPDGILYLRPEPAAPFSRLTDALLARFPQTPPYGGRYAEVVPHLTLDHHLTGATAASLTIELADLLPVQAVADRVDLQWWDNDDCHLRASWRLS